MSIYVETAIRSSMDEVWRMTQTPNLHQRWDLRFTSITYLERSNEAEPRRFRYATRIGCGVEIEGWGETAGEKEADGTRSSALRFGSEDPRSLIHSGSGYWKYELIQGGVRFLTLYDYEVRWGRIGRAIDRLVLRPIMGWATAWSFDRLRLWIETGVDPRHAARSALVNAVSACTIALVWLWQGIVPKLLGPHPDELAMLLEAGVSEGWTRWGALIIGALETAFGLAFVPLSRRRWPWLLTIAFLCAATLNVLACSPHRTLGAFGPITLNLLMATLAAVGLLSLEAAPCARRCLRKAPVHRRATGDPS